MTYRLVLSLPFNILLVHYADFPDGATALAFQQEHYPSFSGLEVWSKNCVSSWQGLPIIFPIGS